MMPVTYRNMLCDEQGKLFEKAVLSGLDAESFVKSFMESDLAEHLDAPFDDYQRRGCNYWRAELESECKLKIGEDRDWNSEAVNQPRLGRRSLRRKPTAPG